MILPTRLSTKLTFRSHCRIRDGGPPVREAAPDVRLGCGRCSGTILAKILFGQQVVGVMISQGSV